MTNKGFSLLELIVTIAILSIGIISIIQLLSLAGRLARVAQNSTRAAFLAQDILQSRDFDELRGMVVEGETEAKKGRFRWRSFINFLPEPGLYKMNLEVSWEEPERKDHIRVDTYLRAR